MGQGGGLMIRPSSNLYRYYQGKFNFFDYRPTLNELKIVHLLYKKVVKLFPNTQSISLNFFREGNLFNADIIVQLTNEQLITRAIGFNFKHLIQNLSINLCKNYSIKKLVPKKKSL